MINEVQFRSGENNGNEYCFKSVSSGAANIQEECDASTISSSPTTPAAAATSPTTLGTTLSPEQTIAEANKVIEQANADMARETENKNAAEDATSALADIAGALEPSGGRRNKRNEDQTTSSAAALQTCSEFTVTYNSFLDTLVVLSDDKIAEITRLVTILRLTITTFPCSEEEKQSVKASTASKAETAAAKTRDYTAQKEQSISLIIVTVQVAQISIQNANEDLQNAGKSTAAIVTPSFTVPPSSSAEPQSSQPTTTEQPQPSQPVTPTGQPESTQPTSTGQPESTQPSSTGQPGSTQPTTTGQPESTQPTSTGKTENTQPSSTGQPESTQPNSTGQPQSSQPGSTTGQTQSDGPTGTGPPETIQPTNTGPPESTQQSSTGQAQSSQPSTTGQPHTTISGQITNGTCPLTQTDLDKGIANQRRISYEEEEMITKRNREREYGNRNNRLFLSKPTRRWPNNEIPYILR